MPKEQPLWAGTFLGLGPGDMYARLCLPEVMLQVWGRQKTRPHEIEEKRVQQEGEEGQRVEQTGLSSADELDEERWGCLRCSIFLRR